MSSLPEVKEKVEYTEQFKIIKDLTFRVSDSKINSALNKFNFDI